MRIKLHDPKCHELAEAFLSEFIHTKEQVNDLANEIQDVIEVFIEVEKLEDSNGR